MKALTVFLAACVAICGYGYEPPVHTNSYTQDGVTYAQRGGLGASNYVAIAVNALENDYTALTNNSNFKAAVETVSPPAELPSKWALANVTNATGGAVAAADVGALDCEEGYIDNETDQWRLRFPYYGGGYWIDFSPTMMKLRTPNKYLDIETLYYTVRKENGATYTRYWDKIIDENSCVDSITSGDDSLPPKTSAVKNYLNDWYLTKYAASTNYLQQSVASSTYETQTHASQTYLTKTDAQQLYASTNYVVDKIDTTVKKVWNAASNGYYDGDGKVFDASKASWTIYNPKTSALLNKQFTYDASVDAWLTSDQAVRNAMGPLGRNKEKVGVKYYTDIPSPCWAVCDQNGTSMFGITDESGIGINSTRLYDGNFWGALSRPNTGVVYVESDKLVFDSANSNLWNATHNSYQDGDGGYWTYTNNVWTLSINGGDINYMFADASGWACTVGADAYRLYYKGNNYWGISKNGVEQDDVYGGLSSSSLYFTGYYCEKFDGYIKFKQVAYTEDIKGVDLTQPHLGYINGELHIITVTEQ